jgi:hypothetical protein
MLGVMISAWGRAAGYLSQPVASICYQVNNSATGNRAFITEKGARLLNPFRTALNPEDTLADVIISFQLEIFFGIRLSGSASSTRISFLLKLL